MVFLLSIRTLSDYDVQRIVTNKNITQAGYLPFQQMLEKFNKTTKIKFELKGVIVSTTMTVANQMIFFGKAIAILLFDYLNSSKYSSEISKDKEYQFIRHIRNGAAHYNKFNLKDEDGNWKLKEGEEIKWEGKVIKRQIHGQVVFNDFINVFSLLILAQHFSDRLKQIDEYSKRRIKRV